MSTLFDDCEGLISQGYAIGSEFTNICADKLKYYTRVGISVRDLSIVFHQGLDVALEKAVRETVLRNKKLKADQLSIKGLSDLQILAKIFVGNKLQPMCLIKWIKSFRELTGADLKAVRGLIDRVKGVNLVETEEPNQWSFRK